MITIEFRPLFDIDVTWRSVPLIATINRLFNSIRLLNLIQRLALLAATDSREYTSLLDRIERRIDYYEQVTYFDKFEKED